MSKTIEDIISEYGDRLDIYADEKSRVIEEYLEENGIEIYNIDDVNTECRINITDAADYVRYLKSHSVKEMFRFIDVSEKEDFLSEFKDEAESELSEEEDDQNLIENACNLYCSYLDVVFNGSEKICNRLIYCTGTYPPITFSCDSDLDKIYDVKEEIIQEIGRMGDEEAEKFIGDIIDHINAAERELEELFEFLVNDPDFRKCTNKASRENYERRRPISEDSRFQNLYWVTKNYYTIRKIQHDEIRKRVDNIYFNYREIYEDARRKIRNRL